ncbi:MAG: MarR family transcriptional regulator [Acidimicrobiales bacterium]|jgi:DNA-binding MarR family transcriptional regulator
MKGSSVIAAPKSAQKKGEAVREAAGLLVAITRITRQLRARSRLVSDDVTPSQTSALARIEQLGPLRLGALAEIEGTSAATMCRVVEGLEERRLVTKVPDPHDGRASNLQLSDEGGALLNELRARSTEVLRRALAELSAAERSTVLETIGVLERLSDLLNSSDF